MRRTAVLQGLGMRGYCTRNFEVKCIARID
jgi:hypothetical protein